MNDRSWDRLLRSIEDGLVVPVLGRQLFTGPEGSDEGLQSQVARRLLEFHGRDPDAEPLPRFRELDEAVSRIKHDCDLQDLYADVHDIIGELTADGERSAPEPIRQIAAITHFRLFVTLTPDDLLARCLRRRCAVNEVVHSPYLPTSEGSDLPNDWQSRPAEVQLLYVFGKSRPAPMFAIHAEDVLEYAHNIIARGGHVPVKFLGELQQRSLLLIGCCFPEWLARFFLRLTNQRRLSDTQRRREWLIESLRPEGGLIRFLRTYSQETEILSDIPPHEFVRQLHQRWLTRHGAAEPLAAAGPSAAETVPPGCMFFISYCRSTDLPAAERLFAALVAEGVAREEIWFDRTALEPGQDFRDRILDGIRSCRYFVPLVSRPADALDEKFFRREWGEAADRAKGIQGRTFVVPLIVDADYQPQLYQRVPRDWQDGLDFGHAPAGCPDERTSSLLKRLIRAERQSRG